LPVSCPTSEAINDIADLLLRYGVRYRGEEVVGDAGLASPVVDRTEARLSYPYWLRVRQGGLSSAHAVTVDLSELFFAEPGALVLEGAGAALVVTTEEAGGHPREGFNGQTPDALAAGFAPEGGQRVLAVQLDGPFRSAFAAAPEGADADVHLAESQAPAPIFVVADVDWIFDPFALQEVQAGGQPISRPLNDNIAFLLNMVDHASGDPALIAIRSRGPLQRPFMRVTALFEEAGRRYRDQETALLQRIAHVEAELARLPEVAGVASIEELPAEIRARVAALRQELLPERRALREIRFKMRESVESLGRHVTLINLAAGPVLVLAFAALARLARRRGRGARKATEVEYPVRQRDVHGQEARQRSIHRSINSVQEVGS
jgi:ABC-2 type transport system permease protein